MKLESFLAYQFPGEELLVQKGRWRRSKLGKNSGFVISDAHAEHFWCFEVDRETTLAELDTVHLEDLNLPVIDEYNYLHRTQSMIQEMKDERIEKVVYSRLKSVPFDSQKFALVFNSLRRAYPNNLNYCLYNPDLALWMGSTPEVLIRGQFPRFTSMALAGTLPVDASDELWTAKEFEEHRYVSDYLGYTIAKYCSVLNKSERFVVEAGPVKHLRNDFDFLLDERNFWEFIHDFHPTPAVCGVPKEQAKALYCKYEMHNRSLYTGIIGYTNNKQTALYVNLRCMQLSKSKAYLYVGGGFTRDSDPYKEWLETERKAETLARFLI